jgi:hypothetical protein
VPIAKEPLNIITYVVKNDRPFTEILTADYTVVNPFLAKAYGVQASFSDPANENEFQPAKVMLGTGEALPHAGVLSTPVFLNRWMTSPTNRNRGRARRVYQFFLATDILKIAERPVDPSAATAHENPTMTDKNCVMCHKIMDPIAGGFRGYDDNDYENFKGSRPWFGDMAAPGLRRVPCSHRSPMVLHSPGWPGRLSRILASSLLPSTPCTPGSPATNPSLTPPTR